MSSFLFCVLLKMCKVCSGPASQLTGQPQPRGTSQQISGLFHLGWWQAAMVEAAQASALAWQVRTSWACHGGGRAPPSRWWAATRSPATSSSTSSGPTRSASRGESWWIGRLKRDSRGRLTQSSKVRRLSLATSSHTPPSYSGWSTTRTGFVWEFVDSFFSSLESENRLSVSTQ